MASQKKCLKCGQEISSETNYCTAHQYNHCLDCNTRIPAWSIRCENHKLGACKICGKPSFNYKYCGEHLINKDSLLSYLILTPTVLEKFILKDNFILLLKQTSSDSSEITASCHWCSLTCVVKEEPQQGKILCCSQCEPKRKKFFGQWENKYSEEEVYPKVMLRLVYTVYEGSTKKSDTDPRYYRIPRELFLPSDFSYENKLKDNLKCIRYLDIDDEVHGTKRFSFAVSSATIIQPLCMEME